MCSEKQRILNGAVMACFEVISHCLSGETEGNLTIAGCSSAIMGAFSPHHHVGVCYLTT
jgi:hypothetical protein